MFGELDGDSDPIVLRNKLEKALLALKECYNYIRRLPPDVIEVRGFPGEPHPDIVAIGIKCGRALPELRDGSTFWHQYIAKEQKKHDLCKMEFKTAKLKGKLRKMMTKIAFLKSTMKSTKEEDDDDLPDTDVEDEEDRCV